MSDSGANRGAPRARKVARASGHRSWVGARSPGVAARASRGRRLSLSTGGRLSGTVAAVDGRGWRRADPREAAREGHGPKGRHRRTGSSAVAAPCARGEPARPSRARPARAPGRPGGTPRARLSPVGVAAAADGPDGGDPPATGLSARLRPPLRRVGPADPRGWSVRAGAGDTGPRRGASRAREPQRCPRERRSRSARYTMVWFTFSGRAGFRKRTAPAVRSIEPATPGGIE